MKKNKVAFYSILVLAAVMAVLALVHLQTRTPAIEGHLRIESNGSTLALPLENLSWEPVQGSTVDGKGEHHPVDAQGVLLSHVLEAAGISDYAMVSVVSDDEYSADISREEIAAPDKVYLIRQEDGSLQLIVFGDANSKRNVRNTVGLVVS